MRRNGRVFVAAAVLALILLPTLAGNAWAQLGSGLAGSVKDSSGAVLPGVTVEAASPALIEKVRTATTDSSGEYKITNLVPGVYTVTFSLQGFGTFRREGIELTTNFTAQINADMKVGAIEETITVSGSSPIVDVQSAQVSQQVKTETVDLLPTGRAVQSIAKVLPGITISGGERGGVDVGGTAAFQSVTPNAHGSRGDNVYQIDGMTVQSGIGNGTSAQYYNPGQFDEYTYTSSAIPAEVAYGGVRIQMTSKDGGNTFHGYGLGQIEPWQSKNYTSALQTAGLKVPDGVLKLWDLQGQVGGPFIKNKLWFFIVHRYNGGDFLVGNSFYHDTAVCQQYGTQLEKDHNCQGVDDNYELSTVGRLTWQATPKNKVSGFYSKENKQRGHRELAAGVSPETSTPQDMRLSYSAEIKWTAPITSRLLWDAGVSQYFLNYTFTYQDGSAAYNNMSFADLTYSTKWGARPGGLFQRDNYKRYYNASLSYVTGSHALKVGGQLNKAVEDSHYDVAPWHMVAQFRTGVATSVIVDDTPVFNRPRHDEWGLFAQDTWTLKRLTVNPGIRYDAYHPWIGTQDAPASPWLPARHFEEINDLLTWKNWSPRFSAVYDLFGNGKTAVKGNVSKYVAILGNGTADLYNPLAVLTDSRQWRDANNDGIPQYTEVGPSTITNFGTQRPRFQDPDLQREQQVEWSASVQHQLMPRMSLLAGFYHRTFYNLSKQVNTLVDVNKDYTPVQVADPRGGGQTLTVYNLASTRLGQTNIVDMTSDNKVFWNGIDLSASGRIKDQDRIYGGMTLGGSSQNMCDVVDPNALRFCESKEKWKPLFKLGGSMPLPFGTQFSGTFSSFPGASQSVTYLVNRTVLPSLTQTSVTVNLDDPLRADRYFDRINQLDLRFAKKIPLANNRRLMAMFDIFNAGNTNAVLQSVRTFGSTVYTPNTIVQGRLFQFGAQFYF
jgi:Carboxypeptidase regulatory-like domain